MGIFLKKGQKIRQLIEDSFPLLNLDNKIIETYCTVYSELKTQGTPIPDADLLIAATSIAHDLTLEIKDEHFQRLQKLELKLR
jgi:predicted nucleic acid-binding protein